MKRVISSMIAVLLISAVTHAQAGLPAVDKSPMDMSYCPANYPVVKMQGKTTEAPIARVVYSRPKKEGRAVFGGLIPYGKVWRLGANEATEIEFFKPVTIGDKKIPAGRYTLYALVNEKSWTFILNKELDIWGAFKYDETKDVVRVDVNTEASADMFESLSMAFVQSGNSFNLVVGWENIKATLPISL
ncbi:MAG: DUF2911 domain-containing protein [Chitinophagaceae bacterium]